MAEVCRLFLLSHIRPVTVRSQKEAPVDRRFRVNNQIRVPQVRLIDADGTQVGITPIQDALRMAQEKGMDLVEISGQANPPVCKITNFSKFRYDLDKKEKEARKKQKTGGHLKEVRFRPRIGEHDLEVKVKHAHEFLSEGHKVQITVVFMGREMQHRDLGRALLEKVKEQLVDVSDVEHHPSMLGNRLFLLLTPKKK